MNRRNLIYCFMGICTVMIEFWLWILLMVFVVNEIPWIFGSLVFMLSMTALAFGAHVTFGWFYEKADPGEQVVTISVGFTGTRYGCTDAQKETLRNTLRVFRDLFRLVTLHEGHCIGADDEAAHIANDFAFGFWVVSHPPTDTTHMAPEHPYNEIREPKDYLERNHDIVDESSVLIACPDGHERTRSGTWATIRYAKKQGKRTLIIHPDGVIEDRKVN